MELAEGSVVELDRQAHELLDIMANGTLIAKRRGRDRERPLRHPRRRGRRHRRRASRGPSAANDRYSSTSSSSLILIPLVAGLACGLAVALAPRPAGHGVRRPRERLVKLLDAIPLGATAKLAVVEFEGKRLLLAVSRTGVQLVNEAGAPGRRCRSDGEAVR